MRLKYRENVNNLITNQVDLGEIVYTNEKIIDSHKTKTNLHDVYTRPSAYKENAFYDIERDCERVHGYGLHIISYNFSFFSTCFYTHLNGVLYAIVDTPSKRIAYTNDKRFDFTDIEVRVYGCRDKWTRDRIRNIVKPYLKAIGAKKARVDYIGMNGRVGFNFLVNNSHMNQIELENFNIDYYKINL